MKTIDTSWIAPGAGLPGKAGVLNHILNSSKELGQDLISAILELPNNSSTVYILQGCIKSASGSTYSISAGIAYYQGELFRVAATSSHTYSNVPVLNIVTTYYTAADADPILCTDNVTRNVLQIRTMSITDATTGSGLADLSAANYESTSDWQKKALVWGDFTVSTGTYTIGANAGVSWRILGKTLFVSIYFVATGSSTSNTFFEITVPGSHNAIGTFNTAISFGSINEAVRCQLAGGTLKIDRLDGSAFPALTNTVFNGSFVVPLV